MIPVYGLTQVAREADLPISVATCKSHMRIINSDTDDDLIQTYIENATDWLEHITNRSFVNTTYDYTLESFPYYTTQRIQPVLWGRIGIYLPKNPVVSVTSVKYKDFDGVEQTFSEWGLNNKQEPARIIPNKTTVWPYADVQQPIPVTIRFIAGYGSPPVLPGRIKTALLYLVSHMYENREPVVPQDMKNIPYTLQKVIGSLRYKL